MEYYKLEHYMFCLFLTYSFVQCGNIEFSDRAFVSVWNSPSAVCERKYGVQLNLSYFDIVANHNDTFEGDEIVIFYGSRLGLYPSIGKDGTFNNGGLPQLANITAHLLKVTTDVERYMPDVGFTGLAVIDWESWRPMFRRDHYNSEMRRYIKASEDLVRSKHPDWSQDKIKIEAQKEFENGARQFIQSTLVACRKLRPHGYWGLYLYPNCYNRAEGQTNCSNATIDLNDRLSWMYEYSTSLFPSIYLSESIGTYTDRYDRVYGQLKEALRVKKNYGGKYLPIVPYSKYIYKDTGRFYNPLDLNNTIQQVAEAGLNAIVLWDSSSTFKSKLDCMLVRDYVDGILGPFIKYVTMKARKCSEELCNSHGRCLKTDWSYKSKESDTIFFEKFSNGFFAELLGNIFGAIYNKLRGIRRAIRLESQRQEELRIIYSGFGCNCFKGWSGQFCQERQYFY